MKFQVGMKRKVNKGKAEIELEKVGRVETSNTVNAFNILKKENKKWDFKLEDIESVDRFDFEDDNANQILVNKTTISSINK